MITTIHEPQTAGAAIPASLRKNRQRGVVLVVALVVLVAMMLASISMVRSVDTATLIAGNLAFKQSATAGADAGIEAAIGWLSAHSSALDKDQASEGYYATSGKCLDLTGNGAVDKNICPSTTAFDWGAPGASKQATTPDAGGNLVSYVIHRVCDREDILSALYCAVEPSKKDGSSKGVVRQMGTYQEGAWDAVALRGFYRITARAAGPKNTASYVQAIVSM